MNSEDLRRSVMSALTAVKHPGSGRDLIAAGVVQNLEALPRLALSLSRTSATLAASS